MLVSDTYKKDEQQNESNPDTKENGIPLTNARIATNEENVNNNNIRLSDVLVNIEKINDEIKHIEQRMKEVD